MQPARLGIDLTPRWQAYRKVRSTTNEGKTPYTLQGTLLDRWDFLAIRFKKDEIIWGVLSFRLVYLLITVQVHPPAQKFDETSCSVVLVAAVVWGSLAAFRARPPLTMSLSSLKRAVASIFEPRAVECGDWKDAEITDVTRSRSLSALMIMKWQWK